MYTQGNLNIHSSSSCYWDFDDGLPNDSPERRLDESSISSGSERSEIGKEQREYTIQEILEGSVYHELHRVTKIGELMIYRYINNTSDNGYLAMKTIKKLMHNKPSLFAYNFGGDERYLIEQLNRDRYLIIIGDEVSVSNQDYKIGPTERNRLRLRYANKSVEPEGLEYFRKPTFHHRTSAKAIGLTCSRIVEPYTNVSQGTKEVECEHEEVEPIALKIDCQRSLSFQEPQSTERLYLVTFVDVLVSELMLLIFSHLDITSLGEVCLVCRKWKVLASNPIFLRDFFYHRIAFSQKNWAKHFGDSCIAVEEKGEDWECFPSNIVEILKGPCPIFSEQYVWQTHKLVWIPHMVNGAPLTLNTLGELIKSPKQGHGMQYRKYAHTFKQDHGNSAYKVGYSHWALMTKDVIPGSRDKSYAVQRQLIAELGMNYQIPPALDVAACILMEHVETGIRLFSDEPSTYTRCQEQAEKISLIVGGFAVNGFALFNNIIDSENCGVAAIRMLRGPWDLIFLPNTNHSLT